MVDDLARATALRADRRRLHLPQDRPLHRRDVSRAMALRAGRGLAAFGSAGAIAVVAGCEPFVGDGLRAAFGSLFERDMERDAHVAAARALLAAGLAATALAAEERAEDIVHAEAIEDVRHVHVVGSEAGRPVRCAIAVIVRTLRLVRQDGVGLVDFLEACFGIRCLVHVWMQLARLLQECTLDGTGVSIMLDPENLVVILVRTHTHHTPTAQSEGRACAPL